MRRGVVLGVCLFTLCVPASAAATPATPGFLAAWKKSDGLYARWDVKAAERELDPLLAQASTLDGHERVWFDLSAARLLGMVGRYDEARAFVADSQAIVGTPVCPPDATSSWDCVLSTGYVRWAHPVSDRCINGRPQRDMGGSLFGKTGGTPEFEDSTILAAADFKPWRFWNMAVDAPAHIGSTLPVVEGFNGVVDSYFGGVQTFPYKGIVPEHKAIWCDILLARLSGGPTGPWSGTSRYTVLISTRERIVRKRSVQPGARISVQAFLTGKRKLLATWKPRGGGPKLRFRYTVKHNEIRIRAPHTRGLYDLQLGVGKKRDFSTGVSGVGVGRPGIRTKGGNNPR